MECNEEVVTSQGDSRWNRRCASISRTRYRQATLRPCQPWQSFKDHQDCVREGAAKQRNVKAWKVMHFRSEAQSLPCEGGRWTEVDAVTSAQ